MRTDTTARPNPQVAMAQHKVFRRLLGLPCTVPEFRASTDPAYLDTIRAEARRVEGKQAEAEAHGGLICRRCHGHGGLSQWPGWTCFDCGGRGWVDS